MKPRSMQPLNNHVVIRRDPDPKEEVLVLAENAEDPACTGTIVAVGQGRYTRKGKLIPPQVSPGDRVLFHSYAGYPVVLDGDEYQVMTDSPDIFAIIEDDGQYVIPVLQGGNE